LEKKLYLCSGKTVQASNRRWFRHQTKKGNGKNHPQRQTTKPTNYECKQMACFKDSNLNFLSSRRPKPLDENTI